MKSRRFLGSVLFPLLIVGVLGLAGTALAQQEIPGGAELAGTGVAGCACLVGLVIAIASLVIWIAICVYVYRDATARGMENAVLWLLLVIVGGPIGLIVYLIVRPPKPQQ